MKQYGLMMIVALLAGCANIPKQSHDKQGTTERASKHWRASTLSDETKETALKASREYFGCINRELSRYRYRGGDSRYETQALLRRCEQHLQPVRTAFAKEGVDPRITRRYLKRKRTQAARYVLRNIMALEAQLKAIQAGEE